MTYTIIPWLQICLPLIVIDNQHPIRELNWAEVLLVLTIRDGWIQTYGEF